MSVELVLIDTTCSVFNYKAVATDSVNFCPLVSLWNDAVRNWQASGFSVAANLHGAGVGNGGGVAVAKSRSQILPKSLRAGVGLISNAAIHCDDRYTGQN